MSYFPPGRHMINVNLGSRVIAYRVSMGGNDGLSPEQFEALKKDLDKVMTLHMGERKLEGLIWNGEEFVKASQAQLKKALDEGESYEGPQVVIKKQDHTLTSSERQQVQADPIGNYFRQRFLQRGY